MARKKTKIFRMEKYHTKLSAEYDIYKFLKKTIPDLHNQLDSVSIAYGIKQLMDKKYVGLKNPLRRLLDNVTIYFI